VPALPLGLTDGVDAARESANVRQANRVPDQPAHEIGIEQRLMSYIDRQYDYSLCSVLFQDRVEDRAELGTPGSAL
jgi:hypothetical protein